MTSHLLRCAGTLWMALQRGAYHGADGQPRLHAILCTAVEVAEGMAYIHSRRVVHGDLSSRNVLLMRAQGAARPAAKVGNGMCLPSRHCSEDGTQRTSSQGHAVLRSRACCRRARASSAWRHGRGVAVGRLCRGFVRRVGACWVQPVAGVMCKGTPRWAQVSDFGLSTLFRPGQEAATAAQHGALAYMPPEMLSADTLSFATDAYSFGVVLWELLTAQVPSHTHQRPSNSCCSAQT